MPRKKSERLTDMDERDIQPTYTVEGRPDLPTANAPTEFPTPMISREMIEIRNREAQQMADRIAASKRGH